MRYRKCLAILFVIFPVLSFAREDKTGGCRVYAGAVYGYNPSYRSYGGLDLNVLAPFGRHFELEGAAEFNPWNISTGVVARPVLPLKTGALFMDASVHAAFMTPFNMIDLAGAVDFGYRMDYVDARVGIMSHMIFDTSAKKGQGDENVSEPVNLLYRIEVKARPATCRWNVSAGIANYSDYEYERTWEPMYFVRGRFNLNDQLRLHLRTDIKPSGAFHLTAHAWGVSVRAGVSYCF